MTRKYTLTGANRNANVKVCADQGSDFGRFEVLEGKPSSGESAMERVLAVTNKHAYPWSTNSASSDVVSAANWASIANSDAMHEVFCICEDSGTGSLSRRGDGGLCLVKNSQQCVVNGVADTGRDSGGRSSVSSAPSACNSVTPQKYPPVQCADTRRQGDAFERFESPVAKCRRVGPCKDGEMTLDTGILRR